MLDSEMSGDKSDESFAQDKYGTCNNLMNKIEGKECEWDWEWDSRIYFS